MDDIKIIDLLHDMVCTIKNVIEMNDTLRDVNRRLSEIEKEHREFADSQIKVRHYNFADVITAYHS